MAKITVQNTSVTVVKINEQDYISLTDMARSKSDDSTAVIANWIRNRNTIEYLGIWETLYNPNFNPLEFEGVKKEAGLNAFTLSPQKWIEATNAGLKGNIRDYASVNELICLSNMESLNAVFIDEGLPQPERLVRLNHIAIQQMQVLEDVGRKYLK